MLQSITSFSHSQQHASFSIHIWYPKRTAIAAFLLQTYKRTDHMTCADAVNNERIQKHTSSQNCKYFAVNGMEIPIAKCSNEHLHWDIFLSVRSILCALRCGMQHKHPTLRKKRKHTSAQAHANSRECVLCFRGCQVGMAQQNTFYQFQRPPAYPSRRSMHARKVERQQSFYIRFDTNDGDIHQSNRPVWVSCGNGNARPYGLLPNATHNIRVHWQQPSPRTETLPHKSESNSDELMKCMKIESNREKKIWSTNSVNKKTHVNIA